MRFSQTPSGVSVTATNVLDWLTQRREDAFRQLHTDLLARVGDIDDWDQALDTIERYRASTANWRDDVRPQIDAAIAADTASADAGLTRDGESL